MVQHNMIHDPADPHYVVATEYIPTARNTPGKNIRKLAALMRTQMRIVA